MRFWDSSALVPVFLVESTSAWVRRVMNASPLRPSAKDSRSFAQTELLRVFYWAT